MTFLVDGKEYEAKLLNAGEARRIYEDYVRKYAGPGAAWSGWATGCFKTSVFPVPPGAERPVMLRFSQLCRKSEGLTELTIPVEHGQVHLSSGREGETGCDSADAGTDQECLQSDALDRRPATVKDLRPSDI